MNGPNKLECLTQVSLSSLALCNILIHWTPIISYKENGALWIRYLWVHLYNFIQLQFMNGPNKLECLTQVSLSSLALCNILTHWTPIISYKENDVLWIRYLWVNLYNFIQLQFMNGPNKIGCFSPASLPSLVLCNTNSLNQISSYKENKVLWIQYLRLILYNFK